jgi:hypothetical protein
VPKVVDQPMRLAKLERRLDAASLVWLARGWRALRRFPRRVGRPSGVEWLGVVEEVDPTAERLVQALEHALRVGAFDSAGSLLERLRPLIASMPPGDAARARQLEVETLLLLGHRSDAAETTRQHQAVLQTTPGGALLLELLGVSQGPWLPDGRANILGLERNAGSGEAAALAVARRLSQRPWLWFQYPELQLLLGNVLLPAEPASARRFLDRFLRLYGLSGLEFEANRDSEFVLAAARPRQRVGPRRGPVVSIVVAAHRCERTLGYALDSLLSQTHQSLEILVADDASDDGTRAVMQRYAVEPRVRLFRSDRKQGAYNVRNGLAMLARGEWLTFHDADDLALPERIERQLQALARPPALACVGSLLRVAPDGRVVFFKDQRALRLSRVSLMLKLESFKSLGGFRRARFGADQELFEKLRRRFGPQRIQRVHAPLMLCASSPGSATRDAGTESLEDGYRSPARRRYSEYVFLKYVAGREISDLAMDRMLVECGNFAEPAELLEL